MRLKSNHIDNNALVDRYQNGDRKALEALVRNFHPVMKKVIRYHIKSTQPIEDIAQECWHDIIQKLNGDGLELKISFNAWAVTIARRRAIDWIRRQQRLRKKNRNYRDEYTAENHSYNNESGRKESKLEKVQAGIQDLPSPQKIVLNMFYLENLSLKEISRVLDISEGTVKSRLYYAREELKKRINPDYSPRNLFMSKAK